MAPVTRCSARDRAPGTPQQQDNSLNHGFAKPAGIRKRLKPDKPDKQKAAPVESSPKDLDTTTPAPLPLDMNMDTDMELIDPPQSAPPEPQNPDGQLDHELTGHVSTILQARATREKEEDDDILEILTLLNKKISSMKQKEQPRALSFGKALHSFVQNFFTQSTSKLQDQSPTAGSLQAEAPQTYAATATAPKADNKNMEKPHTML